MTTGYKGAYIFHIATPTGLGDTYGIRTCYHHAIPYGVLLPAAGLMLLSKGQIKGRPISRSPFYYGFVAATYFASCLVSSAERGLTSLFGMVRGVHPSYPHQQILDDFLD